MDNKRLILFIIFSFALIYLYQQWEIQHAPAQPVAAAASESATLAAQPQEVSVLKSAERLRVKTDVLDVELDSIGGDLRQVHLLKHGAVGHPNQPLQLFDEGKKHLYLAQTGLIGADLPDHYFHYTAQAGQLQLAPGQNEVKAEFRATTPSGLTVLKTLTFTRGSYLVKVAYQIENRTAKAINARAYFRLLRDDQSPEQESSMVSTFTGPVQFTDEQKYNKFDFESVAKGEAEYVKKPTDGWIAMVQHYFVAAWLLNQPNSQSQPTCKTQACEVEIKKLSKPLKVGDKTFDNLYSNTVAVDIGAIAPGKTATVGLPLFVGPQEAEAFNASPTKELAPELQLTRDYGWLKFLASPLFWVLLQLHKLFSNWGLAIIGLTVVVKACLYPLASASYRSMAKMKKLAPKLQELKEKYGDDKLKFQQAMMEMYKTEKVNPLGGCLPMLLQIPVFFALYWSLLGAVELRQAPFFGWITDLSVADPYFVLPAIMAVTMYLQTLMSPPPTDPMQAKMMKFMPLAFSVMFFFFPAGLVLYYLINNLLSILQQWWINRQVEKLA